MKLLNDNFIKIKGGHSDFLEDGIYVYNGTDTKFVVETNLLGMVNVKQLPSIHYDNNFMGKYINEKFIEISNPQFYGLEKGANYYWSTCKKYLCRHPFIVETLNKVDGSHTFIIMKHTRLLNPYRERFGYNMDLSRRHDIEYLLTKNWGHWGKMEYLKMKTGIDKASTIIGNVFLNKCYLHLKEVIEPSDWATSLFPNYDMKKFSHLKLKYLIIKYFTLMD